MANKDDPGRDKARPSEPTSPKKPYATIDLKATEVPAAAAGPSSAATAAAKADAETAASSAASTSTSTTGSAGATAMPGARAADAGTRSDMKASDDKTAGATKPAGKPSAAGTGPSASAGATTASSLPRSGGGLGNFISHAVAAIIGGLLALFGADALAPQLGLDGITGNQAAVQRRLAALEAQAKASAAGGELAQRLSQADGRIARLEEQSKSVEQLTESSSRIASETKQLTEKLGSEDVGGRLAKLEDVLATLSAAAQSDQPGRIAQLAAFTTRLKELETALANQSNALRKDLTQAIETRSAQVAEAGEVARSGTQRIDRDVAALKTDTATLAQRVEVVKADGERNAQTLRVLQQEAGSIRSALDGLKGDVDNGLKGVARPTDVSAALAPVTTKIAALEQGMLGIAKSEEDRRANAERIVLSLELANLKRVVDRGQRYDVELAEVRKASAGRIDLGALDKFKGQGVATLGDLVRDFRPVANAILDADTEPVEGGVMDRLLASAKSIVRVRKVEPQPGDKSAEAIVARMEAALRDGRLGTVLDEARQLQPRAATAAKDWLEKVEARYSVEQALASVESQLKTSLGGVRSEAPAGKPQN